MKLLSIGKFAKKVGLTPTTLRRMHATGELVPEHITEGGTRYYSTEQLKEFQGVKESKTKLVVGYCRVSTPSQKDDLATQVQNLRMYMIAKGYQFEIIEDVGSGINYTKKGLQTLIRKINDHEVSKIVVLYKDRLVRFGFEMLEYFCEINNVEIEIVDQTTISKEQELTDDLIQIITVFANRLYGSRSKKTKRLIEEVRNGVSGKKDMPQTDSGADNTVQ